MFKGKCREYNVSNYRSISLTFTASKDLEIIISNKISRRCNKFSLIDTAHQHGLCSEHSTLN